MKKHSPVPVISRSRLECLFDGIFAIAMTVLVLDLKVPDLVDHHSAEELARALARFGPTFGSYALSFVVLGLFWYRHNLQYHHFQVITSVMLLFQMIQLSMAAFFPFCAALLGRYPSNWLATAVYSGCIFIYAWAMLANWHFARKCNALKPEVSVADYQRIRKRLLRACLVFTVVFGFSLVRLSQK